MSPRWRALGRRAEHLREGRGRRRILTAATNLTGESEKVRRFEQYILVYLAELYRAALRLTGQVSDAEDLVQETCFRAFRTLDQLRHPAAAKVWAFSILRSI